MSNITPRYALECHAAGRATVVTRHETVKSAVEAAARALWDTRPPLIEEIRIVDVERRGEQE